jgi:hypothetical protein
LPPLSCAERTGGVGSRITTCAVVAVAGAAWTCPPLPCLGAPGRPFGEGAALLAARSRWDAAASTPSPSGALGRLMAGAGRLRAATSWDDTYRSSCRGSGLVGADGDNAMDGRATWCRW